MRQSYIIANWKMNILPESNSGFAEEEYIESLQAIQTETHIVICPPFTHTGLLGAIAEDSIGIGAQDLAIQDSGAHTGDISAQCLTDIGVQYVILGHSERRTDWQETSATVKKKSETAHKNDLKAIICIGESQEQNAAGQTETVLAQQIQDSIPDSSTAQNTIIAYEPVWAIGTGKVPTLQDIQTIHEKIRTMIAEKIDTETANAMGILYGGSVKPENAKEILALQDVDGALVGGASLSSDSFAKIIQAYPAS